MHKAGCGNKCNFLGSGLSFAHFELRITHPHFVRERILTEPQGIPEPLTRAQPSTLEDLRKLLLQRQQLDESLGAFQPPTTKGLSTIGGGVSFWGLNSHEMVIFS